MKIYVASCKGQLGDTYCEFFPSRIKAEKAVREWLKEDKVEYLKEWTFHKFAQPIRFHKDMVVAIDFTTNKTGILNLLNEEARHYWVEYAGGEPG